MSLTNFLFGKLKQIKQIFLKTMNNSELNKNKNKREKKVKKKIERTRKLVLTYKEIPNTSDNSTNCANWDFGSYTKDYHSMIPIDQKSSRINLIKFL